ncbi:MAG: iron-siderophore ABC transporter substrate-binding protein [Gammaproteobacteria bacterium]|nr:MAG: iron-siderophore ABC transporter substrate-binding protein [Gammaproteobacteria bacterium]UTW42766.1 iron-siderophore ABC transporter substrate-binding protein [bacterium SCSIO 12844]
MIKRLKRYILLLLIMNIIASAIYAETSKVRVITLEHRYTEMVLSLGLKPVGVADIKSYQLFDGIDSAQLDGVTDVGRRAAPSLQVITLLKPSLILGAKLRNQSTYPVLSSIAPTILFDYIQMPNNKTNALDEMILEFNQVAYATHTQAQATQILQQYHAILKQAKEKVKALKSHGQLKTDRVAIAQFLPGSPKIRLFSADSVAIEALREVGLKPAWPIKGGDANLGYLTVSIQRLSNLGLLNFFYFNERSDDSQLVKTIQSPVWQSFPFVKAKLTYRMKTDTWPWGGPLAVADFVQQIVNDLELRSINS